MKSSNNNNNSSYQVHTTSRLAQWRIHNLSSCTFRRSDPFPLGLWNWHLALEKNKVLMLKLYPEISNFTRDNPPIASFVIRVLSFDSQRNPLVHPQITDQLLKTNDDFVWPIHVPLTGKLIIDVEFLDLKTRSPQGGEPCSIWAEGSSSINSAALTSLSRMLMDGIYTDITINTSNGCVGAHRAVLAARSPVFQTMFSHNLQEKELSTINISDITLDSCQALLHYLYGCILHHQFLHHRLSLLRAADKYDIPDLKEACHASLLQDIDANNVLERLQYAALYQLPELKANCIRYLIQFGKIFDLHHDFNHFLQCADRELIAEIFQEILAAWKGF
ncbi:hypothetical protein RDABS01_033368 [Bienertia sinuspersici]